jgi:RNA polymerase sigma factor (sigma-70 family)
LTTTHTLNKWSDRDLIAAYLREQQSLYFSELYRRYGRKVFGKCYTMLSDEGLARDATQDIFIKVMLNLARFGEQSSFSTWVYSITYNYCIDQIRKKKKGVLIFLDDVSRVKDEEDVEVPDSVLLEMKQEQLTAVLNALPPGDRAILMMKYSEDLSIKEIAEILGKSESAIKMQIMRAKQKAEILHRELFGNASLDQ